VGAAKYNEIAISRPHKEKIYCFLEHGANSLAWQPIFGEAMGSGKILARNGRSR
jgi:hypothetical protein